MRKVEDSPVFGANDSGGGVTPGSPLVQTILTIGLPVAYLALLVMLHVYWLSFDKNALEAICLAGDGIFAAATTTIVGHNLGQTTTTNAIVTGVRLRHRE